MVEGDFNYKLQRHVDDCTVKCFITKWTNETGHGQEIINLMWDHDLITVGDSIKTAKKDMEWKTYRKTGKGDRPNSNTTVCMCVK